MIYYSYHPLLLITKILTQFLSFVNDEITQFKTDFIIEAVVDTELLLGVGCSLPVNQTHKDFIIINNASRFYVDLNRQIDL